MRNLESSQWLESPLLIEIKAMTVNNVRQNEFNMQIKLKRVTLDAVPNLSRGTAAKS